MKLFRGGKDAAPTETAEGAEAPGKARGSNNLVPAVVVAVGLIVGGFLFGGNGDSGGPAAAAPEEEHEKASSGTSEHGPVQNLEAITLNLADGHFLKVGVALQLAEAEGGGHGEAEELPAAKALDIAISHLGTYTMDDLKNPKDRELVKKKLSDQVAKAYVDPLTHEQLVTKVYFTEFVMQ